MTGKSLLVGALPGAVVVREAFDDPRDLVLHPEESAAITAAVAGRRAEFGTARQLARSALRALGAPEGPLLPDADRVPVWPPGFTGSITHCAGFRAAAVGRCAHVVAIGIDAEPHRPLDPDTIPLIASEAEQEALSRASRCRPGIAWDLVLFSAKESLFKAHFPRHRRWFGFLSCEVTLDPEGAGFTGRVSVPGVEEGLYRGRWVASAGSGEGHLATTVVELRR